MNITIDKGIPIPDNKCGRSPIYPWRDMQPGDSIKSPTGKRHAGLTGSAYAFAKRNKCKMRTGFDSKGVFRAWRIK